MLCCDGWVDGSGMWYLMGFHPNEHHICALFEKVEIKWTQPVVLRREGMLGGRGGGGHMWWVVLKILSCVWGVPKQREVIGSCKTLVEAMFKTQYGYVLCGGGSVVCFARVGKLVIVNTHRLLNPWSVLSVLVVLVLSHFLQNKLPPLPAQKVIKT